MGFEDIQPERLTEIFALPNLLIIDQRDASSRHLGQLPGAVPQDDTLIARLARRRDKNPPVLIYCYHGNMSRELCSFLAQFNLPHLYNLQGGWKSWLEWSVQQTESPILSGQP